MKLLTVGIVQCATGSTREDAELYTPFLLRACETYGIDSRTRIAGFLSQIGHESKHLSAVEESLNYSVEGLLTTFRRHRISEADARRYGRIKGVQAANQEAIANCIYGGEWGKEHLGNQRDGDGWRYKGRGLKQLTGLWNYRACGEALGKNLVDEPDLLLLPANAAMSAGWFWSARDLNEIADRGDVRAMTKRINGGDLGLDERTALWGAAMEALA